MAFVKKELGSSAGPRVAAQAQGSSAGPRVAAQAQGSSAGPRVAAQGSSAGQQRRAAAFVKKELSWSSQNAIAQYLANGGKIRSCPPVAAQGNEMSRATCDLVRKARAEYRRDKNEN